MPRDTPSTPLAAEQLYATLHANTVPGRRTQLVLAGTHRDVGIWIGVETERLVPLAALVTAAYPDLELDGEPPPLGADGDATQVLGARWGLVQDAAYPVKVVRAFALSDPVALLLGALSEAQPGETGVLSIVLTRAPSAFPRRSLALARALTTGAPTGPLWERALLGGVDAVGNALSGALEAVVSGAVGTGLPPGQGSPHHRPAARVVRDADLEARLVGIRSKAAQQVFRATITTAWRGPDRTGAQRRHSALAAALGQFTVVGQNAFHPRDLRGSAAWDGPASGAVPRREKTVLSIEELAGLLHLPGPDTVVPYLPRAGARHRAPAARLTAGGLDLARTLHQQDHGGGTEAAQPVGVSLPDLMSHAYVVGPSGTGKTTLLTHLSLTLAQTGCGQIVLDPHGDLASHLLARLPAEHLGRAVLFELSDPANIPTLNPLWVDPACAEQPGGLQVARAVRAAAVRAVFADLWGLHRATTPNLLHFLDAALSALISAGTGTLADLPRLLTDAPWRAQLVRDGGDARVAARWAEFAALGREDQSRTIRAILNKAADFDRNPLLATVFGDPGPGLRLDAHMDAGSIVIVSLPRGLVPEGTVELIGSVIVSLAYQAALAREDRPEHQRPPVVAIIDEFQEFALSTFAKALTATRKYGLGLVVANQNLSRISALSPDLLTTLLANVATLVAFRTAPGDARVLAPYLPPYDAADLTSLAPGHTYWRTPGPVGPHTTAAATPPPATALRDHGQLDESRRRLRPPGRRLVTEQHRTGGPDRGAWS